MIKKTFRVSPEDAPCCFPDTSGDYLCSVVGPGDAYLFTKCSCLPYVEGYDYEASVAIPVTVDLPKTIVRQLLRDSE